MEPRYNEVLSITNDFLYPSNSKIYKKEPRYNETSVQRTNFASPLVYIFVISRFHCTGILAGLKKIVCYTEDFVIEVR